MLMKRIARVFRSLREADEAEARCYASLAPEERLNILLEIIAGHRESLGEAAERFERVHRITELTRS